MRKHNQLTIVASTQDKYCLVIDKKSVHSSDYGILNNESSHLSVEGNKISEVDKKYFAKKTTITKIEFFSCFNTHLKIRPIISIPS